MLLSCFAVSFVRLSSLQWQNLSDAEKEALKQEVDQEKANYEALTGQNSE